MPSIPRLVEAEKVCCVRCDYHTFRPRPAIEGLMVFCRRKNRFFPDPEIFDRSKNRCPAFEFGGVRYDEKNQPILDK